MNWYLIRHGQTDWNVLGKIQGGRDTSLNETGRRQAVCLAKAMEKRPVSSLFCSRQKRAMETAAAIGAELGTDLAAVNGLEEVNFGRWEGMTMAEIKDRYPEEYRSWEINPVETAPAGGESQAQVAARCASAVEEIWKRWDGEGDIALVSHGAALAHLMAYLLGDESGRGFIPANASITTLNYDKTTKSFTLTGKNDDSHLTQMALINK